ncbi:Predicted enzyme related to lactoylglutathione lyase [Legionella wadsworthii]|uniref:Predicted enzyme related to lactoylglutathione lyase n=1 Tax=Legionella wadsworthii TaxID=28088 RepID=A0A378LRW1_9GAMM|nr:VOC family protein [Legionella wadsworthii]STY28559.1 Predicted enzyme related to lactoylglutathione lyase [Legionella wadsworthii]
MTQNTFCWTDIPVVDLDRAIAFYSAILNEPVQKFSEHGFEFGLLPHTEDNVSGCLCVIEGRKPSQDGPLVYLNAEGRLDQAIDAVRQQKGTILKAKEQIGPYGHRAVIVDSEGNAVALYSKEA